jgi:hypothetical protein
MKRRANYASLRSISFLLLTLSFGCYPTLASAQTRLLVQTSTGEDHLRGGNTAFINLVLTDGTVLSEQVLNTGELASRSTTTMQVTFPDTPDTISATQIRSIRIRHDGNPRSGHPFDTYDNWDLRTLRVDLADSSFRPISPLYVSASDSRPSVVSSRFDLLERFTRELQQIELPIRAINNEPDFTITSITGSPSGLSVEVRNIGLRRGRVTNLSCSSDTRAINVDVGRRRLAPTDSPLRIRASLVPGRRATCSISGVDSSGRPEAVTANNRFSQFFP